MAPRTTRYIRWYHGVRTATTTAWRGGRLGSERECRDGEHEEEVHEPLRDRRGHGRGPTRADHYRDDSDDEKHDREPQGVAGEQS